MQRLENYTLNLNCQHLLHQQQHNNNNNNRHRHHNTAATATAIKLYKQILEYPQDMIPILDHVATEAFKAIFSDNDTQPDIQVRVFGLPNISKMRCLDPTSIEKLVAIKGMIIRTSSVIPDPQQAFFRCFMCAHVVEVLIEKGRIEEPASCPSCQRMGAMQIIHNRSIFSDKQLIRMQEMNEEIPEGETPYTVNIYAFHDLVDSVRPGDRIEVTGVFRAIPRRLNPKQRTISSVFKTYVDCIHLRRCDVGVDEASNSNNNNNNSNNYNNNNNNTTASLSAEEDSLIQTLQQHTNNNTNNTTTNNNNTNNNNNNNDNDNTHYRQFTTVRIQQFLDFSSRGNCYERLVKSFAPSIWGMDDVKRGILCLLFGGTLPDVLKKSRQNKRVRNTDKSNNNNNNNNK
jgi:DNA replication licensing factor MCM4